MTRKLKQDVALEPLVAWWDVERPIRWQPVFGNDAPVEVEIGFGLGEFLARSAVANPERNYLGLEVRWRVVHKALRRMAAAEVSNVRLMFADARLVFGRLIAPESVARIHALFPCPWPRERDEGRRLFSEPHLRLLASRLALGGELRVVSDHDGFRQWVAERVPTDVLELRESRVAATVNTKYERKWLAEGAEHFYELLFRKTAHMDIPIEEDVALIARHVSSFDPDSFRPKPVRGELMLDWKDVVFDPRRNMAMVRVNVKEEHLMQRLWISVRQGKDGLWVILPAEGCSFIPTPGVQRALDEAAAGCGASYGA